MQLVNLPQSIAGDAVDVCLMYVSLSVLIMYLIMSVSYHVSKPLMEPVKQCNLMVNVMQCYDKEGLEMG